MKKVYNAMLWLAVLMVGMPSVVSAKEVEVKTAKEFVDALNANYDMTLKADIDLSGTSWSAVDYGGTINGLDHTEDGEEIWYALTGAKRSIFGYLNGATLHHLLIKNCTLEATGDHNTGLLAYTAKNSTFENVGVENCSITDGIILGGANIVGLLVGLAENVCSFKNVYVTTSSVNVDGSTVGALAGKALNSTFNNCIIDASTQVRGAGEPMGNVGGIVGWAEDCELTRCVNTGLVGGGDMGDCIGGICGTQWSSTFTDCINNGVVVQVDDGTWGTLCDAAVHTSLINMSVFAFLNGYSYYASMAETAADAMLGHGMKTAFLEFDAASQMAAFQVTGFFIALEVAWLIYDAQDPDEVGGICGYAAGGQFERCINGGTAVSLDAYCGGIVGYATDNDDDKCDILSCLNTGNIIANEQAGGIVGSFNNGGTLKYCIHTGSLTVDDDDAGPIFGERDSDTKVSSNIAMGRAKGTIDDGNDIMTTPEALASGEVALELNAQIGQPIWRQNTASEFTDEEQMTAILSKSPVPCDPDETLLPVVTTINENPDTYVHVSTKEAFLAAIANRYIHVYLDDDISLTDGDKHFFSFCDAEYPFEGSIDGGGHTISGLFCDEYTEDTFTHAGLFLHAKDASFRNLTLKGANVKGSFYVGALVGESTNCVYDHVTLAGKSYIACAGDYVGGLVGRSHNDTFAGCIAESNVTIYSDGYSLSTNAIAGGLVGGAENSTFEDCVNRGAKVMGDDDRVGGIVAEAVKCNIIRCTSRGEIVHENPNGSDDELGGIVAYSEGCTIKQCMNFGWCDAGDAYCGGIVGYACAAGNQKTTIEDCLNAGSIDGDEQTGGICGYLEDNTSIDYCLNTGTVKASDDYGPIFGDDEDGRWTGNCYYSDQANENTSQRAVTIEQLASGQVAYYLNRSNYVCTTWRQNLEGDAIDAYPLPDATHSTINGDNVVVTYEIANAEQLLAFAEVVNGSYAGSRSIGILTADIDLTGCTWQPIGTSTYPFIGRFDGQGHTISHLVYEYTSTEKRYHGFFGYVAPGVEITDLTLDATCSFKVVSKESILAAFVGGCNTNAPGAITLTRLVNYASVYGKDTDCNTAGIMGGIFLNDAPHVVMTDCANLGLIEGNKESAALVGYARHNAVVTNCWNGGTLNEGAQTLIRTGNNAKITNCYTSVKGDGCGATYAPAEWFTDGELCYRLNGADNAVGRDVLWYQTIGNYNASKNDPYPLLDNTHGRIFVVTIDGTGNSQCVSAFWRHKDAGDTGYQWISEADDISVNVTANLSYYMPTDIYFEKGLLVDGKSDYLYSSKIMAGCFPYDCTVLADQKYSLYDVNGLLLTPGTTIYAGTPFFVVPADDYDADPLYALYPNSKTLRHCTSPIYFREASFNPSHYTQFGYTYTDGSVTHFTGELVNDEFEVNGASMYYGSTMAFPNEVTIDGIKYPVRYIKENSIRAQSGVTTLVIPSAVEYIGNNNFDGFIHLAKVIFADGDNPLYVGYNVGTWVDDELFYDCDNLRSVVLGRDIMRLTAAQNYGTTPDDGSEERPFEGIPITSLTITEGCTKITESLFYGNALTEITLPATVTLVEEDALDCSTYNSIARVTLLGADNAPSIKIVDTANFGYATTVNLDRDVTDDSGKKGAYSDVFHEAQYVTIGSHVTAIHTHTFGDDVKTLDLSKATALATVDEKAFDGSDIEYLDFSACSQLTTINSRSFAVPVITLTLPPFVTTIANEAFDGNHLINLTVPATCTTIGEEAFDGEDTFKILIVEADEKNNNVLRVEGDDNFPYITTLTLDRDIIINNCKPYFDDAETVVVGPYVTAIPDFFTDGDVTTLDITKATALKSIGKEAFYGSDFTNTPQLVFPASLESIGRGAFDGSGDLGLSDHDLTLIDLSACKNLTDIPDHAFDGCQYVKQILLPEGLETIGEDAFNNCEAITSLTLPSTLKSIGKGAFYDNMLTSLVIPPYVSFIGEDAFDVFDAFCNDIATVRFLGVDDSPVLVNDDAANFKNTTTIYLDRDLNAASPKYGAHDATKLGTSNNVNFFTAKDVTVGPHVHTIEYCAFGSQVEHLDLTKAKALERIETKAFYQCEMDTITLPANIRYVGTYAFQECRDMVGVDFSHCVALDTIADGAFIKTALKGALEIPEGVTHIGADAFMGTDNTSVILPSTLCSIGIDAFEENALFSPDYRVGTVILHSYPRIYNQAFSSYSYESAKWSMHLTDDSYLQLLDGGFDDFWYKGIPETFDTLTYTRRMTSRYGTLVLPFAVRSNDDDDYALYTFDGVSNDDEAALVMNFTRVQPGNVVPMHTPVLVCKAAGADGVTIRAYKTAISNAYENPSANKPSSVSVGDWTLRGTYKVQTIGGDASQTSYYIASDKFWRADEAATVPSYRAWLTGPQGMQSRSIALRVDGATIILTPTNDGWEQADAVYDLQGRKVEHPNHGIYIVNGKKVWMK